MMMASLRIGPHFRYVTDDSKALLFRSKRMQNRMHAGSCSGLYATNLCQAVERYRQSSGSVYVWNCEPLHCR